MFLDMPASTRDLYFQLGMRADDDGFVSPRGIMRLVGASEDDLKILIGKKYVIPFESGVIVIRHWKVNNLVRKDWYRPTQYTDEMKQLNTAQHGAYTLFVNEPAPVSSTQVGRKEGRYIAPQKAENAKELTSKEMDEQFEKGRKILTAKMDI